MKDMHEDFERATLGYYVLMLERERRQHSDTNLVLQECRKVLDEERKAHEQTKTELAEYKGLAVGSAESATKWRGERDASINEFIVYRRRFSAQRFELRQAALTIEEIARLLRKLTHGPARLSVFTEIRRLVRDLSAEAGTIRSVAELDLKDGK